MKNEATVDLKNDKIEIEKNTILFVCTGNTCRSPMCAALYNAKYAGMTSNAFSRGIFADGSPISENAVRALSDYGIRSADGNNYERHISKNVTAEDLEIADQVICVSSSHMMNLIMRFPSYASKISTFSKPIPDPYGGALDDYKRCLSLIDSSLSEMFLGNCNGL